MIETNYRAFISYNHKDRDKAVWLQRQLESYRVPRKLVDILTSEGSVPRRLTPIFRDEECMAAGADGHAEHGRVGERRLVLKNRQPPSPFLISG